MKKRNLHLIVLLLFTVAVFPLRAAKEFAHPESQYSLCGRLKSLLILIEFVMTGIVFK